MERSKENSPHYQWGNGCSGWRLVDTPHLSVIEERMPPGTREKLHFHQVAQQFFRILKGSATFKVDGETRRVDAGSGYYILPGSLHQIRNDQDEDLEF